MKLSDYNRRRKIYLNGGVIDPPSPAGVVPYAEGSTIHPSFFGNPFIGEQAIPKDSPLYPNENIIPNVSPALAGNYGSELDLSQSYVPETTAPDIDSSSVSTNPTESLSGGESNFGNILSKGLQFLPDIVNFATGVAGKDKTRPATRISRNSLSNYPSKYNINPVLSSNRSGYVSILRDPSATANQKLAALSMKQRADSQAYAEKQNKENQMQSNKASIQANLDSRQAQYDNQYREDKMISDANLGIDGNFARNSLFNISTKVLQMFAQNNQSKRDEQSLAAMLAGKDPQVIKTIMESLNNA